MGQILIKPGVILGDSLHPAGARILDVVKELAAGYDFDVTITSGRDGVHSGPDDPHHQGAAFDFRTNTLTAEQKQLFLRDLQHALYKQDRRFYVFIEDAGGPNEHCHCQKRAGTDYDVLDWIDNL